MGEGNQGFRREGRLMRSQFNKRAKREGWEQ
jgi:hypothetical protein